MAERLKGQEITVNVISSTNGLEDSFADVGSAEVQFDRDILSEGYLGQSSEQKDDIVKGVSGNVKFHCRSANIMGLIQRMNEKSKGRLPGEEFQLVMTLLFPLGGTRRLVVPNASFGAIPISIGGRDQYVEFTIDFAAEDATIIASV